MQVKHSGYEDISAGSCYGEGEGRGISYHTNTTRSHISGNHDGALSVLELVEDPVTLVLLLVTVNG